MVDWIKLGLATKTARDPKQMEQFNKNHEWLKKLRLLKNTREIIDFNGNTIATDGKGL